MSLLHNLYGYYWKLIDHGYKINNYYEIFWFMHALCIINEMKHYYTSIQVVR